MTTVTLTSKVRPHEVLVMSSRPPASLEVWATPVATMMGTATIEVALKRRTIGSNVGSVNHALVPNASISRPPIHSETAVRCTASTPIHNAAGRWALAWPMLEYVSTSADTERQRDTAPDRSGATGEREQQPADCQQEHHPHEQHRRGVRTDDLAPHGGLEGVGR